MGRSKKSVKGVYSDRVIDIDLLLYDNIVFNSPELVLPHPLMTERAFVMTPLSEIAGGLLHPVFRKTISELKQSASGKGVF